MIKLLYLKSGDALGHGLKQTFIRYIDADGLVLFRFVGFARTITRSFLLSFPLSNTVEELLADLVGNQLK